MRPGWRAETSASGEFRRCGVLRERLEIGDHEHLAVGTRLQCPIGVSGAVERESPGDLADDCWTRLRSSSVLTFRARAQRSCGGRKCRECARGPTTTAASAATLVSRLLAGRERHCQPRRGRRADSHESSQRGNSRRSSRRARGAARPSSGFGIAGVGWQFDPNEPATRAFGAHFFVTVHGRLSAPGSRA